MPRDDEEEERAYANENSKPVEEKVKIVSDSELLNLKLDNVLKNQSILSNSLQNIIELLSSEQSNPTN